MPIEISNEYSTERYHTFLVAGEAEVAALAGKSQGVFMAAILTFDKDEAVV